MNKLILANHKMLLNFKDIENYLNNLPNNLDNVIFFPSTIFIPYFKEKKLNIGIQNISNYETGNYTGEVSAQQVSSLDISYALVGHSETRNNLNDTNNKTLVKALYLFNFNQPYIAYYNDGNILYKTEKYDQAIKKYQKALTKNPPQKRVCDIRINLSLAIIKKIDYTNYETAFNELEEAKNNLYNNNCASATDSSGNSQDAEKLEEEIKKRN